MKHMTPAQLMRASEHVVALGVAAQRARPLTNRQAAISLALDAYASAVESGDVDRRVFYRAKVLELVEMRQTDGFPKGGAP